MAPRAGLVTNAPPHEDSYPPSNSAPSETDAGLVDSPLDTLQDGWLPASVMDHPDSTVLPDSLTTPSSTSPPAAQFVRESGRPFPRGRRSPSGSTGTDPHSPCQPRSLTPSDAADRPPGPRTNSSQTFETKNNVRFVVANHHEDFRNPKTVRQNRVHVMHHWLANNPQDPRSRAAGRRQRLLQDADVPSTATSINPAAPNYIFGPKSSSATAAQEDVTHDDQHDRRTPETAAVRSTKAPKRAPRSTSVALPLVRGINGQHRNYKYLGTPVNEVPFIRPPSGPVNPFPSSMPQFNDASLNVDQLKYRCSICFGSRSISEFWVPELLKARHAFLSTICISSSYDDIMRRGNTAPQERRKVESVERALARKEITSMINDAMSDPCMQSADSTIIAVLHLLNAEMMGCDDRVTRVHRDGLCAMIEKRGGLTTLGVNGQLASISSITMYLIAALWETPPPRIFAEYAKRQRTKPPQHLRLLPESPLYYRPIGYITIATALSPENPLFDLLETARELTEAFFHAHDSLKQYASKTSPERTITDLAQTALSSPSGDSLDFPSMSDRYTYEAVRLTSHIYAQALLTSTPFSTAAQHLRTSSETSYTSLATGYLSTGPIVTRDCALHIHIRNALIHTDTSECWGHLAGVLFWVGIVAGGAANPAAWPGGYVQRRTQGEDEEARKWLVAIAVRCSIVLGFEFGTAVMETLKRGVAIQRVLDAQSEEAPDVEGVADEGMEGDRGVDMPKEADAAETVGVRPSPPPPTVQPVIPSGSMNDYARDFWAGEG